MKTQHLLLSFFLFPCALQAQLVLPDSLDNTPEFWEKNRVVTERARKEMPWGEKVPALEWNNFVVPVRINNELLDSARTVFFEELAPRVRNLSMTDAALEVNHWCHEKVTYRPSDARTSSPLATLLTSWGRCGEESTFTVAALRAVGIPARQVYTPRWAHTDDNHAWVEVWTDGKWHFLGACEPEAVLDLGWFNAPASRGMLMTTRVRNRNYDGPEEVLDRNDYITTINVTSNYAPVSTAQVFVKDTKGNAVDGANVMFMLYNYGEFYPIARKTADSNGIASLNAGKGDMVVWAINPETGQFGYAEYNGSESNDPIEVILDKDSKSTASFEFNITPPVQSENLPYVSDEQMAENNRRKALEDSIRGAYMDTFLDLEEAGAIAAKLNLPRAESVAKMLRDSYGNHRTIVDFLKYADDKNKAINLLEAISAKDLRDIEGIILRDHYASRGEGPLFSKYIMNPRVANENLTPYKSQLTNVFSADSASLMKQNPDMLVNWVRNNISVSSAKNPEGFYISPLSVGKHRTDIDPRSRNVFFVSLARTLGIPARIDPVTAKTQWADDNGKWHDARFEADAPVMPKGALRLSYDGSGTIDNPAYYYHFTISRIDNGKPVLLEFDEENTTVGSTFSNEEGYTLDAGQYMLVSGQRLADGTVLAHAEIFMVNENNVTDTKLIMRNDAGDQPAVIGNFNSENLYYPIGATDPVSILSTTGRGYYILGVIRSSHEPSAHAINDIKARAQEIEKWPVKVLMLAENADDLQRFRPEQLEGLPSNVVIGHATKEIIDELASTNWPTFIIADTFNRVVYRSDGYTINLPEALSQILVKL